MSIRCPVCKADNAAGPACRRCKADLAMLFSLEDQRAALLEEGRRAFERGSIEEALRSARAGDDLRHGDDARRCLAVLSLLNGRFGEAWQAYQSTCEHG